MSPVCEKEGDTVVSAGAFSLLTGPRSPDIRHRVQAAAVLQRPLGSGLSRAESYRHQHLNTDKNHEY